METYMEKLYLELSDRLLEISDTAAGAAKKLALEIQAIKDASEKVKLYIAQIPLKDEAEEIAFFKQLKPKFTSEQVYALELYTLTTTKPLTHPELIKQFYERELLILNRYFKQYQFLYQYYKLELTDLDHVLFVRGAKPSDLMVPDWDINPLISTRGDLLFARFIAWERLQLYILSELRALEGPVSTGVSFSDDVNTSELKWTGQSINLVEVAYGIWLTGQLNNGNAGISETIKWLEKHFQVKIGAAHRRWQSISNRKRITTTKYIDEMKAAMLKRLDEEVGR